jgi:hypothetical protein
MSDSPVPIPYAPIFERIPHDEAETTAGLISTMRDIAEKVYEDGGHAERGVHAKSHALLTGELTVESGLPEMYAQGLFAEPKSYPVLMRFSTIPGDVLDDEVSTPRGLAVKVIGVAGERLPDFPDDVTQDFLFASGLVFPAPTPKDFLQTAKLLAKTTDAPQILKKALSVATRGAEAALEAVGGMSSTLLTLGGHPATSVLTEEFGSQGALLYGRYMAKLSVVPASPGLKARKGRHISLGVNGLRDEANEFCAAHNSTWELRTQLCTDVDAMPIEDPSREWPEKLSPHFTVARIRAPRQTAWSVEKAALVDDRVSFNPWRGLAAHRPLGAIMRVRREVYAASTRYRMSANEVALFEPRSAADLPQ